MRQIMMCLAVLTLSSLTAGAQGPVRHIQKDNRVIADAVWAGDTLYVSGQTASPKTPADKAKGTDAVYGDTEAQTTSILTNLDAQLKAQGLGLGNIVMMHVYLVGDPTKGGKMDFAGMMTAYSRFFGTKDQPYKPARFSTQVVSLAAPWALVEIEVIAAKGAQKITQQ